MNSINRQKFLAELGRLLTFMYEEDRQEALALYNRMFDEAEDEQSLLHFLVSPTRQAVVIARVYDAQDRKLSVHSQSKDSAEAQSSAVPAFVTAIEDLSLKASEVCGWRQEAPAAESAADDGKIFEVSEDQISLFEEPEERVEEQSAEAESELSDEENSVEQVADAVDAFLKDFSVADGVLVSNADTVESENEEDSELDEPEQDEPTDGFALGFEPLPKLDEAEPVSFMLPEVTEKPISESAPLPEKKANVPLLVLYIIFAVPLTLLAILILLVPAALSLLTGGSAVYLGILAVGSLFDFAVFADIMVVVGAAVILFALALLFLWIFVWFIGGAVIGLIRGVVRLGRKWCYKEVQQ